MPTEHHHLYRWRMDGGIKAGGPRRLVHAHRARRSRRCYEQVGDEGPIVVGDLDGRVRDKKGTWWDWDDGKIALETCSTTASCRRHAAARNDFARRLRPHRADAPGRGRSPARRRRSARPARSCSLMAAQHHGRRHAQRPRRLPPAEARRVEAARRRAGRGGPAASPVEVEGWTQAGVPCTPTPPLHAPMPGAALLSPFDSLVWNRERTERLFGFHYRIEIYVPQPKRHLRLLRAAVPARRSARRPRRPEGRSRQRGAAGPGVHVEGPRHRRWTARSVAEAAGRRAGDDGSVARARRRGRRVDARATWPRICVVAGAESVTESTGDEDPVGARVTAQRRRLTTESGLRAGSGRAVARGRCAVSEMPRWVVPAVGRSSGWVPRRARRSRVCLAELSGLFVLLLRSRCSCRSPSSPASTGWLAAGWRRGHGDGR